MITKLNSFILTAGDNVSAALVLFIAAYLGIEYLNFGAIWDFVSLAGYGTFGGFVGAMVFSLLMFANFWMLIAYKTKGYHTALLWAALIAFTGAVGCLNYFHAHNAAGVVLSVTFPLVTFLAGLISKDTIGYQIKESKLTRTLKDLLSDVSKLRADKAQLADEITASRQAHETTKNTQQAEIQAIRAEIDAARLRLEEIRTEARQAQQNATAPAMEWVQAVQLDALIYAGWTKKDACERVGVSDNTATKRLKMLNGQSLQSEATP